MTRGVVMVQPPAEIWAALSSIDLKVLEQLAFLCRLKARERPGGAAWCHPGRRWLAERLRCSVSTVSRHVCKLRRLGVLDKFQPRPRGGIWRTNVYRLLSRRSWRLARIGVLIERVAHRSRLHAHYSPKESAKRGSSDSRLEFSALYERWMSRGKATETS